MAYSDPLSPITSADWSPRHARHLLNRAGFGIPIQAADHLAGMTPEEAVALFVDCEVFPRNLPVLPELGAPGETLEMMMNTMSQDREARALARQQMARIERERVNDLKTWWLEAMAMTRRPLEEKMALFWHGHFATSAQSVRQARHNWMLNNIFRERGLGNVRELTFEVAKSPAMMIYLDNRNNRRQAPNENFARELLELFTLGIGHYTEEDVRGAARAFTGHSIQGDEYVYRSSQHDGGIKTFLGRTGRWNAPDILRIIFEHPACSRFIARKIWEFFSYADPEPEVVEELAAVLRESDFDLRPMLRVLFLSRAFHGTRSLGTQIKSPVQFYMMLTHETRATIRRPIMAQMALRGMGQDLFYPPNVKGWEGNRAWIDSNRLLLRMNIPTYVIGGVVPDLRPLPDLEGGEEQARPGRPPRRVPAGMRFVDTGSLFQPWRGKSVGELVTDWERRCLVRAVDVERRLLLVETVAGRPDPSTVYRHTPAEQDRAAAMLQLLMATAEYQLC